ncbi:MAG: DUF4363 family protein [Eubacterium sp.]|nr:DUF4363 family protein [Eubacterium sp.]
MKRLVTALCLLAFAVAVGVYEQTTVNSFYDTVNTHIGYAQECVADNDFEGAYRQCEYLDVYFNKEYKFLALMINNTPLDELGVDINEIKALAENKDKSLESRLLGTRVRAWQIKQSQKITLQNIF